jgi:hypothetical protein
VTNTSSQPQSWTAGDLVLAGRCTAQCLLAFNSPCDCPCNGRWHGRLTAAEIGDPKVPWYARHCGYSQLVLDQLCPAIRSGIPEFNRHYHSAKRDHRVFAVAQRRGRVWETHVDVCTEWSRDNGCAYFPDEAIDMWEALLIALIRARRAKSGSCGRELPTAYGVKTQAEAQVLGAVAVEMHAGNCDGARACLAALDEDGFVRPYQRVTA